MALPKEPRQLMINLMYLVLTALLALNVSNEILQAFRVINQSMLQSNRAIRDKNEDLYKAFNDNENMEGQRERVKPFNDKAKEIKAAAEGMFEYLNQWKIRMIDESGGYDSADDRIKREDNIDASTLLLVNRNGGDSIKSKIIALRQLMLSVIQDPNTRSALDKQLPLRVDNPKKSDNNPQGDWSTGNFYNMPTVAAVTLFSKFQSDVRNSEQLVVNELFKEAANQQVRFDAFKAIAVPKTSYALAGQKVDADILLAAYNTVLQPTVTANTGHVTPAKEGVASWEGAASGVGLQTVKGTVSINMNGTVISKPYEFQYMVGSTGASMQLDKMNVFYIGVPNPITVSAAGYSLEDVSVSIPGATVTPNGKGHYDVTVSSPGQVTAAIVAKTPDGVKTVGTQPIRIKMIPDPQAEVGGKSFGGLASNIFRAQVGVIAALKNFDFDARFVVTSYQISILPRHGELVGPYTESS
ncbi:MAG TPA: gliding motility protein GldM, partial [Flavipsychrobacter sp.]|nr:gliding motility protein GldM [Flavipsychrobacter sp.]